MMNFLTIVAVAASLSAQPADSVTGPTVLTLDQALQVALSENVSVKVADKEIERTGYAKKGTYAALFPQIDGSAGYQYTIAKQGFAMGDQYMRVGKENNFNAGVTAAMPIVNAQLWKSLEISGQDVELAVEKARSSRIDMVTQVKNAYYTVLLAKESELVYKEVYDNANVNCEHTQKRYNAQKASELDLIRAKANVSNAVPNLYDSRNALELAKLRLKAVMGLDLSEEIDVAGGLEDYTQQMFHDYYEIDTLSLDNNTTLKQLEIQSSQLANTIKVQQYAYIPTLNLAFNFSYNVLGDGPDFSKYIKSPYSVVGVTLNIPIFSGGKRYTNVKQTRIQKTELDLQKEDTERQLRINMRQYLTTMETNLKSFYASKYAMETAEKAYDIANKSYTVGRSTLTDLNDSQLVLTQSRLSLLQSVYAFLIAKSNLEGILGNNVESEIQ